MGDDRKVTRWLLGGAVAAILLVGAAAVVALVRGWETVRQAKDAVEVEVPAAGAWAAGHDQQACLDEALRRLSACAPGAVACLIPHTLWLSGCLPKAAPTAGMCDGAPRFEGGLGALKARWQVEAWVARRCQAAGLPGHEGCEAAQGIVATWCGNPRAFDGG